MGPLTGLIGPCFLHTGGHPSIFHTTGFQAEDHKWHHPRAILELRLHPDEEKIVGTGDRPGFSPGVKLSYVNLGKSFNLSGFQFLLLF